MAQSAAVAQSAACALFLVSPIVEGCESLPPRIDLLRDQVVIGRSRKNATVVVDPPPPAPPNVISRKHASIVYEAPHTTRHIAERCSCAFIVSLAILVATILVPYFVAFHTSACPNRPVIFC